MMTFSQEISRINQQKLLNHGKIFSSLFSHEFPVFRRKKNSTVEGLKYH